MIVDYIIVGQGIAGSVLAWQLLQANQKIVVINNQHTNQASSVAAGLYNPITGRHLAETWLADQLFPALTSFYTAIEKQLKIKLLHPYPIFRPFLSQEESITYLTKHQSEDPYTTRVNSDYQQSNFYHACGGIVINQGGYLDIPCFLNATRTYLHRMHAYREADFDYHQLKLHAGVQYQGIQAKGLIFCEGPQAKQNPFFGGLHFRLVKGELLHLQLHQALDVIYNRSIYMIPKSNHTALVGPTYNWQDLSLNPTAAAREQLENILTDRFKQPYQVTSQQVGIRPATFDRRPFMGAHPDYPQLGIFNGLGTKGVSLAPYLSDRFVKYWLLQQALPDDVCLKEKRWKAS